ncbi:MAG: hypothetical protein ACRDCN_10790 [Tannerellaceae bacterium]
MKKTLINTVYIFILLFTFSCQKETTQELEEIYERGASQVSFGFNITTEAASDSWRNPLLKSLKSELPDSVMLTYVKVKGPHGNPDDCVQTSRAKIYLTPSGLKSSSFYMNPGWYKLIDVELKALDGRIIALGANGNEQIISKVPDGEAMGKYFVVEPFSKPNIQTWVLPAHSEQLQLLGFSYTPKNSKEYLNIPTLLNLSGENNNYVLQSGEIYLRDSKGAIIDKNILISGSRGWIYINRDIPESMKYLFIEYKFGNRIVYSDSIDLNTQVIPLITDNTIDADNDLQLLRTVALSSEEINQ